MDVAKPGVGFDRREGLHLPEQVGELLLPLRGEEEVVERMEAAALVRFGDGIAVADHLVEEVCLRSLPAGDLLAQLPVKRPEVRLDLPEVGEEFARHRGELLIPITLRRVVEHRDVSALDLGDLSVDEIAAAMEFGQADLWILLGPERHLAKEFDDRVEP